MGCHDNTDCPEAWKTKASRRCCCLLCEYISGCESRKRYLPVPLRTQSRSVNSLDEPEIIFVPDRNLALYVAANTKKQDNPMGRLLALPTTWYSRATSFLKRKKSDAQVLVHPECRPEVVALADKVLSTAGMLKIRGSIGCREFIIGTELGLLHRLRKENPQKKILSCYSICSLPEHENEYAGQYHSRTWEKWTCYKSPGEYQEKSKTSPWQDAGSRTRGLMKVFLELIRYKNCAMAGLAGVIGAAIAYSASPGDILLLPVVS